MISFNNRTNVGSIAELRTNSFTCCISTLPGFFRGSIAFMRADANGEIVKWPPVGKAYLMRGMTREQRDAAHDYISDKLDQVGDSSEVHGLAEALSVVLTVAKANGVISKYIIDHRFN